MSRLVEPASALHASAETCSCWMWSDPHVENLKGDSSDFMPHADPVHTLAAKAGEYKICLLYTSDAADE